MSSTAWLKVIMNDTTMALVEDGELLVPYPADGMDAYEVSTLVNSPKNDMADVIARVGPELRLK